MSAADPSKRVFMSMDDNSEFLKKPDKITGTASGKNKTLRFDLDLFEPDEYKFPEFNYTKLVHIEKVIWTTEGGRRRREERIHFFRFTLFRCLRFVLLCRICQFVFIHDSERC